MLQVEIFLSETFIDVTKFEMAYALAFNKSLDNKKSVEIFADSESQQDLSSNWQHLLNNKQIIQPSFTKKEDFKKSLDSFYQQFPLPTILFLGSLSQYSLDLQQGMLKLLEEPPKNLQIVLLAQTRSEILPTISSRCLVTPIPKNWILKNLDQSLMTKIKEKLPQVDVFAKTMIKKSASLPDLSKIEREELQFWLWQLGYFFEQTYKQNPSLQIAKFIESIHQALLYNNSNVQKKLLLGILKI